MDSGTSIRAEDANPALAMLPVRKTYAFPVKFELSIFAGSILIKMIKIVLMMMMMIIYAGSMNRTCDISGGQCHCRSGVTGRTCDKCESFHYGFSEEGCRSCNCSSLGSTSLQCDADGQCPCRSVLLAKLLCRCHCYL